MLKHLHTAFADLVRQHDLSTTDVTIQAKQLTAKEAIGETERQDYPLLTGKESLMQAEFKGVVGQAFTDQPVSFQGTIGDILALELTSNGERALFIATLNAVLRHLGLCERTVHCRNREPEQCATEIARTIADRFGVGATIGIVGYQPAIIENCCQIVGSEQVRVIDLDRQNIGTATYGVVIADGRTDTETLFVEADVILATGSTIVNDTLEGLHRLATKHGKPIFYYGTTVAGAAALLDLPRLCFRGA